ncbi:MAG TPA: recombinase family protein [Ktedonobacterales bacterium]
MAVLFLRKSDENAEADDFDIQEDVTRAYAARKGYGVYAVYREAHSGKHSPLTRTVLRQAINDVKTGRANVIIIRSYDRLARTIEQTYHILFEVEQLYHGRVEAALEQLDRDSPVAKIQFAVMAAASEMERDRIYERMEAGKRKRAARGYLMGSPNPRYGYAWVDDAPGKRTAYVIDSETGPVVQRMFAWAAEGLSVRAIARELNRQGVLPPSAYAAQKRDTGRRQVAQFWHAEQVRVIVEDERYAGKPVAFRYKTSREYRDGREVEVRTQREEAVALTTDVWPALVTPEQFTLARGRLQTNVAGRKPLIQALMRGHVYCGVCGRKMAITSMSGGNYAYVCRKRPSNAATPEEACQSHNMRVRLVDEQGWRIVRLLMASREDFTRLLRERFTQPHDGAILASAAGALQAKQEELNTLTASVGLTASEAVRKSIIGQMEAVAEQVSKLEAAYRDAQEIANNEKAAEAWIQATLERIYSWHSAWVDSVKSGHEYVLDQKDAAQLDALPFELRRVAVEASGIKVKLYPVGWLQAHEGMAEKDGRLLYTFDLVVDDFLRKRIDNKDHNLFRPSA